MQAQVLHVFPLKKKHGNPDQWEGTEESRYVIDMRLMS